MTRVVFETATIADAVRKAAKVAPTTKGGAWDKAHGLLMSIAPGAEHPLVLSACDPERMFYREWVGAVESDGVPVRWRLPAQQLATIVGTLPIGSGRIVTFTDDTDGKVTLESGRGKWRFNRIDPETYPTWQAFDPDELSPVPGLGGRIKAVEWAAAGSEGSIMALDGVHLNGKVVLASDRRVAARLPCPIEHIEQPITIPTSTLSTILKESTTAKLAVSGSMLNVMPDEWTQIKVVMLAGEYPKVERALATDYPVTVAVDRDELVAVVNRVVSVEATNRTPIVRLFFGRGEIAVMAENEEVAIGRETVDAEGADHKRIEYKFNPKHLVDALVSAPTRKITLSYDMEPQVMIYVRAGDEYEAWVARTHVPEKQ